VSWQHTILVGILLVDLFSAGRHINPSVSEDFLLESPEIVEKVRNEIGDGRLFRSRLFFPTTKLQNELLSYKPSFATLRVPSDDIIWKQRWELELLRGYLGAFYQFPLIFHDGLGLANTRFQTLKDIIYSLSWERRISLLSAGAVSLILTEEALSVPGLELLEQVRVFNSSLLYLYRNTATAKRVEFVSDWKFVTSDDEALHAMLSSDFDPRKFVVLQEKEKRLRQNFGPTDARRANPTPHDCRVPHILVRAESPHSASFSVSNDCAGYLVFSEPLYPGWTIELDGELTDILQANYAFSGIFLSPGTHRVKRYFSSNSSKLGMFISLFFCGILFLGSFGWRKFRGLKEQS
jgi:hypothetical protein